MALAKKILERIEKLPKNADWNAIIPKITEVADQTGCSMVMSTGYHYIYNAKTSRELHEGSGIDHKSDIISALNKVIYYHNSKIS